MPTTVTSLMIFLILLLPGFVFQRQRERDTPEREWSVFRETLAVVATGLAIDLGLLFVLILVKAIATGFGPDPGAFIRAPREYVAAHYTELYLWVFGFVLTAAIVASLLARSLRWRVRKSGRRSTEAQQSSWWLLFREHPQAQVYVGCMLDDGSYVAGVLHSYSRSSREHPDRDLTLRGDISYRAPGVEQESVLPNVNAVAISARKIQLMTVTYVVEESAAVLGAERRGPAVDDA